MPSPFDLVSLNDYKIYTGITSTADDAAAAQMITAMSRAVLTVLNRRALVPTRFTETRNGYGESAIFLDNWPVTSVASVVINGRAVPAALAWSAGMAAPHGYLLDVPDLQPPGKPQMVTLMGYCYHRGRQNIIINYTAGYQISEEAQTVPGDPYQLTASTSFAQPYGAWAVDLGVTYASSGVWINAGIWSFSGISPTTGLPFQVGQSYPAGTAYPAGTPLATVPMALTPTQGQYSVTPLISVTPGVYTFAAVDAGTDVLTSYGFIPADLAIAVMDWVSDRMAYSQRVGIQSKSLGGQETVSYLVKSMPDFVRISLQQYANVVPLC
jgi:hypothetical protein